jgi:exodeoxyribonuclease VII small subunit
VSRETYDENMRFMEETLGRIERNEVSMDELEPLAKEFAKARAFCTERLDRIEAGLMDALKPEENEQAPGQ